MNLKVSVEYYNEKEKKLFKAYPNNRQIDELVNKDVKISKDEILSYMMFTEQGDEEGWKTYSELKERVNYRLGDVDEYLNFTNDSIQAKRSSEKMSASNMTERIGVSVGINVINKLHGLTEADWAITKNTYLDGKRVKDFDYEYPKTASDGSKYILIENKGTVNDDNKLKSSSVSKHYKSIKDKKEDILKREALQGIKRHENIYYGTITVLDNDNVAKVWLVDPNANSMDWEPKKFKLISRLLYYFEIFKEIGIDKKIVSSLEERIKKILDSDNINVFDKKHLELGRIFYQFIRSSNFVSINNSYALGTFFQVKNQIEGDVFIVAIPKALIKLIISQDFDQILKYDFNDSDFNDKVSIELSSKFDVFEEEFKVSKTDFVFDERKKKYIYQKYQNIKFTSSGRIFGTINSK